MLHLLQQEAAKQELEQEEQRRSRRRQAAAMHHQHKLAAAQIPAASANLEPEERVLLIVNDHHIEGGGVPIIGRRLPSKSASYVAQEPQRRAEAQDQQQQQQQQLLRPIVVGRRSHRQQQEQRNSQLFNYQYHDVRLQTKPLVVGQVASPRSANPASLAQLHLLAQAADAKHLKALGGRQKQLQQLAPKQLHYSPAKASATTATHLRLLEQQQQQPQQQQGAAELPINEYSLPPMQKAAASYLTSLSNPIQLDQYLRASPAAGEVLLNKQASRSRQAKQVARSSPATYEAECPCCMEPEKQLYEEPADTCQGPCCSGAFSVSEQQFNCSQAELARSTSCQRISSTCTYATPAEQSSPSARRTAKQSKAPSSTSTTCLHNNNQQQESQFLQHQSTSEKISHQQRQPRSNQLHHNHQNHHSCKANGAPFRPSNADKPPVAYRSSSCHDHQRRRHQANSSTSPAVARGSKQPLVISGRNLLPVHPKPFVNYNQLSAISNNNLAPCCQGVQPELEEASSSVTQMYESLAAELKAKLGDPKHAPILLPPKDYDTMSRKQGKLTGIELRRSTNPALVGPTANRLSITTEGVVNDYEHEDNRDIRVKSRDQTNLAANDQCSSGSTRSSGRSQDDRSIQRSRSNSSSGLGSISIGLSSPPNLSSSPTSSKLSSNEDMRSQLPGMSGNSGHGSNSNDKGRETRLKHAESSHHYQHHFTTNNSPFGRKNCSPDTCGSSDSGHSGSGRLDSASSSEEQKITVRDTGDVNSGEYLHDDSRPRGMENTKTRYNKVKNNYDEANNNIEAKQNRSLAEYNARDTSRKEESSDKRNMKDQCRGKGIESHHPSKVSAGSLWNGRVEVPLKVNSAKNGNTYLATKQIIY